MKKNYSDLKNIFFKQLTVNDIAETLTSPSDIDKLSEFAQESGYDSILYLDNSGKYYVYENISRISAPLEHDEVISDSTPLKQAFEFIVKNRRVFIKSGNRIDKIATISDLNKISFRIWMFGIISILEMKLRIFILENLLEDWQRSLSPGRLNKVKTLYSQREQKNMQIDLIECIQLIDALAIITENEDLQSKIAPDMTKKKFTKSFEKLNNIRDELAHSNQSFSNEWSEILDSLNFAENLIEKM
jgi:hypothetical protein